MKTLKPQSKKHARFSRLVAKAMKDYRESHPVCEWCSQLTLPEDPIVPAEEIHHVVLRAKSKALQTDPRNLCALCKECHRLIHEKGRYGFLFWFKYGRADDFEYLFSIEPSGFVKVGVA